MRQKNDWYKQNTPSESAGFFATEKSVSRKNSKLLEKAETFIMIDGCVVRVENCSIRYYLKNYKLCLVSKLVFWKLSILKKKSIFLAIGKKYPKIRSRAETFVV